jgi:hypothetical protein
MVDKMRLEAGADAVEFCARWAGSPAMASLVRGWHGELPTDVSATQLLAWLEDFSTVWDFRRLRRPGDPGGTRERNEVEEPRFTPGQHELVRMAATELGLRDTAPPARRSYDHIVILGGLARGCISRPLAAAALLRHGVDARRVTALTSFRKLNRGEQSVLESFAIEGAHYEVDVTDAGMRRAFDLAEPDEVHGDNGDEFTSWRVSRYHRLGGHAPVQVVAAPSVRPGNRANTAETCRWLAANWQTFQRGESMLIVTTLHYRLFQLADAIREIGLPFGLDVDGVGILPGEFDSRLEYKPKTQDYLQETRSSIIALRALLRVAASPR